MNTKKGKYDLSTLELNSDLWNSFKNRITVKPKLTDEQKKEIELIIEFSRQLTAKRLDHRACLESIKKTSSGYDVYLMCAKNKCNAIWKISININKREASVTGFNVCSHLISNDNTRRTIVLKRNGSALTNRIVINSRLFKSKLLIVLRTY